MSRSPHPSVPVTRLASLALAGALVAMPAGAQRADSLTVGMRVRLEVSDRTPPWLTGTYDGRTAGDSLRLRTEGGALVTVAPERVLSIARSERQYTRSDAISRGVTRGFLIGGGITLAALALVGGWEQLRRPSDTSGMGLLLAAGAGVVVTTTTTIVGGMAGAADRDDWRPVARP